MYQAKGEKVEIHILVQVNGILISEMLMHNQKEVFPIETNADAIHIQEQLSAKKNHKTASISAYIWLFSFKFEDKMLQCSG